MQTSNCSSRSGVWTLALHAETTAFSPQDPGGAPEPAPAPTSGGLTAEQRARIEANKARALALRRERAAQAAEGRAAGGEAAAFPESEDRTQQVRFVGPKLL